MKRASAQVWWIIIAAIVALIVMFVLVKLFTDTTGDVRVGLLDCSSKGGECLENCAGSSQKVFKCPTGKVCCFQDDSENEGG